MDPFKGALTGTANPRPLPWLSTQTELESGLGFRGASAANCRLLLGHSLLSRRSDTPGTLNLQPFLAVLYIW